MTLSEEFGLKHSEIANKVGKSREYVSNAIRLLALPEEMLIALGEGKITEGHTRPLLMLIHKPEEQNTLFKEIMLRRLTVRDAESISRKIAIEKVRKPDKLADPEIVEWEQEVGSALGTRVHVEKKEQGGRIHIDYFNEEDLKKIMAVISAEKIAQEEKVEIPPIEPSMNTIESTTPLVEVVESESSNEPLTFAQEIEVPKIEEDNEDIYSVRNFNI
jgi:ParB-like chromosome segregation protein Spo0J